MTYFAKGGLIVALMAVAGCSETGFQDLFDSGKYSPDETRVRSNHALTTPPDLQLRPPSGQAAPNQQQAYQPQQQYQQTPPPAYQQPQQPPAYQQQQAYQPQQPQQPQQPAYVPPQTTTQTSDPYVRHGISKVHPDGRPKSQAELIEELRKKKLQQEKAKNPNYGTIFNMGNVWKDG